jgi:hypothetical protein
MLTKIVPQLLYIDIFYPDNQAGRLILPRHILHLSSCQASKYSIAAGVDKYLSLYDLLLALVLDNNSL